MALTATATTSTTNTTVQASIPPVKEHRVLLHHDPQPPPETPDSHLENQQPSPSENQDQPSSPAVMSTDNDNNRNDNDMTTRAKTRAQNVLAYGQRQVDRAVSPGSRQQAYERTTRFATERPVLASFLLTQLLLALFPLLLFVGFVLSCTLLAFACASCVALFWGGVALLVLVPTLLFCTIVVAVPVWLWALGSWYAGRWVYARLGGGDRPEETKKKDKQVIYQNKQGVRVGDAKMLVEDEVKEVKDAGD
ncbi:hypothetical protein F4780DRAFT_795769 [Xylariomycetidae sp. FL0641]|nr:hypothetical protein F4780DRAFT_795769 [Xylariomycetidae sp. FL0641]